MSEGMTAIPLAAVCSVMDLQKNWDMIFMAQPTHRGDAVLSEMQNAAMSFIIMEQEQMLLMDIGR